MCCSSWNCANADSNLATTRHAIFQFNVERGVAVCSRNPIGARSNMWRLVGRMMIVVSSTRTGLMKYLILMNFSSTQRDWSRRAWMKRSYEAPKCGIALSNITHKSIYSSSSNGHLWNARGEMFSKMTCKSHIFHFHEEVQLSRCMLVRMSVIVGGSMDCVRTGLSRAIEYLFSLSQITVLVYRK